MKCFFEPKRILFDQAMYANQYVHCTYLIQLTLRAESVSNHLKMQHELL
jgi:hypothetical protein